MKWIDVKKQTPEKDQLVIVTNINDKWVCAGQINDDGLWYNQWQDRYSDIDIIVTHWMPLPKSPQD